MWSADGGDKCREHETESYTKCLRHLQTSRRSSLRRKTTNIFRGGPRNISQTTICASSITDFNLLGAIGLGVVTLDLTLTITCKSMLVSRLLQVQRYTALRQNAKIASLEVHFLQSPEERGADLKKKLNSRASELVSSNVDMKSKCVQPRLFIKDSLPPCASIRPSSSFNLISALLVIFALL